MLSSTVLKSCALGWVRASLQGFEQGQASEAAVGHAQALLSQYACTEDVVVGVLLAGRRQAAQQEPDGAAGSLVPLRCKLPGAQGGGSIPAREKSSIGDILLFKSNILPALAADTRTYFVAAAGWRSQGTGFQILIETHLRRSSVRAPGDASFLECMQRVREAAAAAWAHRGAPLAEIVAALGSRPGAAHFPLFQTALALREAGQPGRTLGAMAVDMLGVRGKHIRL